MSETSELPVVLVVTEDRHYQVLAQKLAELNPPRFRFERLENLNLVQPRLESNHATVVALVIDFAAVTEGLLGSDTKVTSAERINTIKSDPQTRQQRFPVIGVPTLFKQYLSGSGCDQVCDAEHALTEVLMRMRSA